MLPVNCPALKIFKSVKYYLLVFSWSKLARNYMIWYFTGWWEGGWSELDNKDHLSWAGLCWAWQKLSLNEVSNKNNRKFLPWWQLSSLLVQFHKSHQLVTTHLRGKSTLRGKKIISAKAIRAPMKVSYDDLT